MQAKYRAFTVAGLGAFLATFESSSVNVALPTLSEVFHADLDIISWVVLSYTLTIGPTLLLFATLAKDVGVKRIYFVGFALFILGCIVAGTSFHFSQIIIGRIIQGLGGSMIMSLGPAMITHAFPAGERGRGMGYIGMVVGAGLLIGPALGGVMVTTFGWRSIFLAPIPLGITAYYFVPKIHDWRARSGQRPIINYVSALLLLTFLGSILYGLNIINKNTSSPAILFGLGSIALVSGGYFIFRERRDETKMIGFELFRNRNFVVSAGAMLCVFIASSSTFVLIPFYVERQLGETARVAGLCLALVPFILALLAAPAGKLADRFGSRVPTIFGLLFSSTGLFLLREVSPERGVFGLIVPLIVYGIGMGFFGTPNSSDLMGSVKADEREIASGIMSTTRTLSITFGVAISSALFVHWAGGDAAHVAGDARTLDAYRNVFTLAVGVSLAALAITFLREPGRR